MQRGVMRGSRISTIRDRDYLRKRVVTSSTCRGELGRGLELFVIHKVSEGAALDTTFSARRRL